MDQVYPENLYVSIFKELIMYNFLRRRIFAAAMKSLPSIGYPEHSYDTNNSSIRIFSAFTRPAGYDSVVITCIPITRITNVQACPIFLHNRASD